MDFFGIGNAIKGCIEIYRSVSHHTGRTTRMIYSLRPGDMVVFTNNREADRVARLCEERGVKDICFVVCDPKYPGKLFNYGTQQGRCIFDHSWVEDYYQLAIEKVQNDIDSLQNELSGYSEAHIKTREAAKNIQQKGYEQLYYPGSK